MNYALAIPADCQCEQCRERKETTCSAPAKVYYANGAERRARMQMAKRVAPDSKGYRWSVGYSKACGYYSAGFPGSRFMGSSLNRKFKKEANESQEEKLHREASYITGVAATPASWSLQQNVEHSREIMELRIGATVRGNNKDKGNDCGGLRCEVCGNVPSICNCDTEISGNRIHMLSTRSKSKVRDKATAFYRACPHKRCFVTLTFISEIQDRTAMSILNKFLTQLKKKFPDLQYLWVAERQDNGNIHFHMIVNRRLPVAVYNPLWVLEQYNSGLVAKNKYGNEIPIEQIRKRYRDKTIGEVLNPFDIKKVVSINNLSAYLTKYIVKQNDAGGFKCAAWHCSRGVSRLFTRALCSPNVFADMQKKGNWMVSKTTGEIFEPVVSRGTFWVCVRVNNKELVLPYLAEMEGINKMLMNDYHVLKDWRDMPMCDDSDYVKYYLSEN